MISMSLHLRLYWTLYRSTVGRKVLSWHELLRLMEEENTTCSKHYGLESIEDSTYLLEVLSCSLAYEPSVIKQIDG